MTITLQWVRFFVVWVSLLTIIGIGIYNYIYIGHEEITNPIEYKGLSKVNYTVEKHALDMINQSLMSAKNQSTNARRVLK